MNANKQKQIILVNVRVGVFRIQTLPNLKVKNSFNVLKVGREADNEKTQKNAKTK